MNNNEIQRYKSILLGKENVETLSDLQLLFNRYNVNISRRFDAVKNGEPMLYRREDLTQWAKEAFERGEKYFYCKPVDEKNPYGPLVLCEPEYKIWVTSCTNWRRIQYHFFRIQKEVI